jgi:hypothetical protein
MQREGVAGDVDERFSSGDELEKCRKEYPTDLSVARQIGELRKQDPSAAMMKAQEVIERERKKGKPHYYGGSARRRMLEQVKNRSPFF